MILVFEEGSNSINITKTNFNKIINIIDNTVIAEAKQNGEYYININTNEKKLHLTKSISNIPSSLVINGKWNMVLENEHFSKIEKRLTSLSSWADDISTKNFSGTGKYEIQFNLSNMYIDSKLKLELDLGKIGNIGEVFINGKNAGTIWMKGQRCDITKLVNEGMNELLILITNTNINRVSAFTEAVPVPENLVEKYGKAKVDITIPREFGFKPLPPSGLMGPVKIIPSKLVKINWNN